MKKIRVLVITTFFYPHVGGSQQYMEELYSALLKKYKNVSVEVLCYNTDGAEQFSNHRDLKVTRINCINILTGQFAVPNIFSLAGYLFKNKDNYDVIHCSTRFFDIAWWGPVYAKLIKKPIILTDHCAFHPTHQNILISSITKLIDLTVVNIFLKFYNRIISTNKATQRFLKQTFSQESEVIYGGIDPDTFKPLKNKLLKTPHIIFIGRMIDSKGVNLLFNYATQNPHLEFTFAGPGYLKEKLRERIKQLDLKNVKVLGKLTKIEVAELMQSADILIHPSFHSEGFPNILTEAGASKLAVIATDTGGSNEIIIDKKTGVLIEPKNQHQLNRALDLLIENKELRQKYSSNLYEHVKENFNWQKSADLQYKILESLVK